MPEATCTPPLPGGVPETGVSHQDEREADTVKWRIQHKTHPILPAPRLGCVPTSQRRKPSLRVIKGPVLPSVTQRKGWNSPPRPLGSRVQGAPNQEPPIRSYRSWGPLRERAVKLYVS
jgi:hypothetical protein